jgi:hypothetical protein
VSKCNCTCCHNNADHFYTRKGAVESTLERNPNAFRSKISFAEKKGGDTSTKHHKGCHCKKSNCLKKYCPLLSSLLSAQPHIISPLFLRYCECFQGGVVCSEKCRCFDCRNFSGSAFRHEAIQRIHLKERHSEGEAKGTDYPTDAERPPRELQQVERPKIPSLQAKQFAHSGVPSFLNERSLTAVSLFASLSLRTSLDLADGTDSHRHSNQS